MSEDTPVATYRGGKRCVAGGCSQMKKDGVSLHSFPFDRPAVLRQWTLFVQSTRKNWKGPTKFSVLCSSHFSDDAYPAKYRIMESMGVSVGRKDLNKDAVPSIWRNTETMDTTPVLWKRPLEDQERSPMTSTPKKPRRAFQKRETQRILLDFEETREEMPEAEHVEEIVDQQALQEQMPQEMYKANEEKASKAPVKETRTVGSQLSLPKPSRISHYTQTKWKGHDKVVQVGNIVKTRDIGITCNLIPAPPLGQPPEENCFEQSFSSEETETTCNDDKDDETFDASFHTDESDESMESDEGNGRERKFIVYESQLMSLFTSCPSCASPALGEVHQVKGSCITILQECGLCQFKTTWCSQPFVGAIPAGNFEMSCALLFSGSLPSKTIRMFNFMNLATISYRTFMYHQQCYLHPAIVDVWKNQQDAYIREILDSGQPVQLGGDGRADSPGHCAKFGSYTMMDLTKNIVVDLQLVQSNEVGSSCLMEKEGLIRSVQFLEQNSIIISQLVTDRHLQVAKWVRENMPNTTHNIDVWHVAKGLKKKLVGLSKEKDCQHLVEWIKSIVNQLYWVPSSTPEDEEDETKWEKWSSILNHIQNIHVGHGNNFQRCEHGDLDPNIRQKRWLRPGTKVMEKLEAIIDSRQMRKDIPKLSPTVQTSNLEAYHSVINHFAPKMNSFSYKGMQSRLILAAMHFNENSTKNQAATKEGDLQYRIIFPKQKKGEFTVQKVKAKGTYGYVEVLMNEANERVLNNTMPHCEEVNIAPPPLCDQYIHPQKDDAVRQLLTRFRRN